MSQHTPGPWELGHHAKPSSPRDWTYVQHHFPDAPYEGDFDDEWGIYPPLGESGPVAIVAGEANARLIAQAPAMREALLKARETIKALHGEDAWDIYEAHSPEMKQIDGVLRAIHEA